MSEITKPIALDESLHTTEPTPRNLADVLSDELQNLATAISGGSDKAPKTDIATVEPTNTASRAYSVGELVYVNGNLYKVITAIASGATFTVGTNIQSANVSGTVKEALDEVHTWTKFGTTTSTTASALSIPASASEVLIVLKTSAVLATAVIPKGEFNNSWSIKNPADTSKEVYYSGSQWRVTGSGYIADAYYR